MNDSNPFQEIEEMMDAYDDHPLDDEISRINEEGNSEQQQQQLQEEDEAQEPSFYSSMSVHDDDAIGIAMAGGYLRASATCMSVLRGLQQKKLKTRSGKKIPAMDLVKYNSGISGGSLPAALYTYAKVPTDQLLETNRTHDPSKITKKSLKDIPKTSMASVFVESERFGWKIFGYALYFCLTAPVNIFRIHSLWARIMYEKMFEKFNIPRNKYFTSGPEELDQIMKANGDLRKDEFIIPRKDVKTMPLILISFFGCANDNNSYIRKNRKICQATWFDFVLSKQIQIGMKRFSKPEVKKSSMMTKEVLAHVDMGDGNLIIPVVVSPSSVEMNFHGKVQLRKHLVQFPVPPVAPYRWGNGGGCADGCCGNEKGGCCGNSCCGVACCCCGKICCQAKKRMSIEYLVGMSTNWISGKDGLGEMISNERRLKLNAKTPPMTYKFGDGGANDLMGIIPLVQKKVKNIILVYNFGLVYEDIYKVASATKYSHPDFDESFTEWLKRQRPTFTSLFGFFGGKVMGNYPNAYILNHVFWDPNLGRLKELMIKFNLLYEAGEPLIATLEGLETIHNPFWGIEEGQKVNLTIMYFNMPRKFSEKVPFDVVPPPRGRNTIDSDGRFFNKELRSVPELSTEPKDAFRYTNAQINMLGYLGSWMVHHAWNGLKSAEGEEVFKGFDEIFMPLLGKV